MYLNVRARVNTRAGRWISEVGFLSDLPFSYAALDPSNSLPLDDTDSRTIDRVLLVPYGLQRDITRLESGAPADRTIRSTRGPSASGLAPYPGDDGYIAAADLGDDTSVPEKTSGLLAAIRTPGTGLGYHAVITRAGAVYIAAPLDEKVNPVAGADTAVCVAIEGAARRARGANQRVELAPMPDAQLASLAILIAKIGSAYLNLEISVGSGVLYAVRPDEPGALAAPALLAAGDVTAETLARRVEAEGVYDISTEVFRRTPPTVNRRAEAQIALGREDTLGATTLLLGAYADVAAADRSDGMQQVERRRVFVERARVAHQEGEEGAQAAADAASAERLSPLVPAVENVSPHAYNYLTGLWGDETPG